MIGWERKKVLMLVKTYPTPSTNHHETVCTAGITSDGNWIRLYPIMFRYLKPEQQFEKYTWIECYVQKNPLDTRPESFKVDSDSIVVLGKLDSRRDLEERKKIVLPLVVPSYNYIRNEYNAHRVSLGIFKPSIVNDIEIKETDDQWDEKRQAILDQQVFGGSKPLEKIPYDFYFDFECLDDKKPHVLKTTDWEVYETFRNFRNYYSSEKLALEKLKEKYIAMFASPDRDSYLVVGSVHRWPTFIIIGYFSYPYKKGKEIPEQLKLFSIL